MSSLPLLTLIDIIFQCYQPVWVCRAENWGIMASVGSPQWLQTTDKCENKSKIENERDTHMHREIHTYTHTPTSYLQVTYTGLINIFVIPIYSWGPDTLKENLQTLPIFGLGHISVKLVLYSQLRGNNKKAIWAIHELPCANRTGDADWAPTFSLLHEKIYNQLTRNPVYDQIVVKIEITFYYSQSSS